MRPTISHWAIEFLEDWRKAPQSGRVYLEVPRKASKRDRIKKRTKRHYGMLSHDGWSCYEDDIIVMSPHDMERLIRRLASLKGKYFSAEWRIRDIKKGDMVLGAIL